LTFASRTCGEVGSECPIHSTSDADLLWVRTFDTIEELRAALVEFATRYNENWLVPGTAILHQPRCEPINALDQDATAHLKLAA
jgi:putative transposase